MLVYQIFTDVRNKHFLQKSREKRENFGQTKVFISRRQSGNSRDAGDLIVQV